VKHGKRSLNFLILKEYELWFYGHLFNFEPITMFLLGVVLVNLSRFGRSFFKKHSPTKTLLSDKVNKLPLRDFLKLKLEILQKKS